MTKLYDSDHPYYCSDGCYYVSRTLGHETTRGYDGNTCHAVYASWDDFKNGKDQPPPPHDQELRRQRGISDPTPEDLARQEKTFGKQSMYDADEDLNLLFRWDWKDGKGEDENGVPVGESRLSLFYMLQRKARPQSVEITVTHDDEPEIRAWLTGKWRHMQRLWAPLGPDIDADVPEEERAERTMVHYAELAQAARNAERR